MLPDSARSVRCGTHNSPIEHGSLNASVDMARMNACATLTCDGLAVDFERRDVRPSTGAMSGARHQVDEADFVHLAQIGTRKNVTGGDATLDVERHPFHIRQ